MADVTYTCVPCSRDFPDRDSLAEHQLTDHTRVTEVLDQGEAKEV